MRVTVGLSLIAAVLGALGLAHLAHELRDRPRNHGMPSAPDHNSLVHAEGLTQ